MSNVFAVPAYRCEIRVTVWIITFSTVPNRHLKEKDRLQRNSSKTRSSYPFYKWDLRRKSTFSAPSLSKMQIVTRTFSWSYCNYFRILWKKTTQKHQFRETPGKWRIVIIYKSPTPALAKKAESTIQLSNEREISYPRQAISLDPEANSSPRVLIYPCLWNLFIPREFMPGKLTFFSLPYPV